MSNKCREKLPHSCGTRRGLQVFEGEDGNANGYCFSCGTYVSNPYGEPRANENLPPTIGKSDEQIEEEILEVATYPTKSIPNRKLRDTILKEFGVKTSVSEEDGTTPTALYYPYYKDGRLTGYKIKTLGVKKIWSIGDLKNVDLFGWERARFFTGKKLIITEGEDDAIALTSIIERNTKEEYKDYMPAVVSIPHGSGNAARDIDLVKGEISKCFREIVLCFDMDKPGRDAVKDVMLILPNAQSAELPCKDAQECLMQGRSKAAFNAVMWKTQVPKNTKLVFTDTLHKAARQVPTNGDLTWPWEHLNKTTRGIRYGETVYIGAGVKMGKSEVVNALTSHFIEKHRVKVLLAKPEESNNKTYKLLAGKIVGRRFHDPNVEFDFDAYDRAGKVLDGKVATLDLYQHLGWETLKNDIVSAVGWGAKVVMIDPITNLTNGLNSGEANSKLQEIAQELAAMAIDYNIIIFIFCHLNAHDGNISKDKREKNYHDGKYIRLGNCPHEYGGDVYSNQFAGSRAMMRSCNLMLGLEGNKDDVIPQESRNIRHIRLLEDREFGETGVFPIYWNPETTLFKEC